MTIKVHIRHVPTGEERVWLYDEVWDQYSEFSWIENNFSCDCNRHLVWLWAAGVDTSASENEEWSEHHCGDEVYSIHIEDADGKFLCEDQRWQKDRIGQEPVG